MSISYVMNSERVTHTHTKATQNRQFIPQSKSGVKKVYAKKFGFG